MLTFLGTASAADSFQKTRPVTKEIVRLVTLLFKTTHTKT